MGVNSSPQANGFLFKPPLEAYMCRVKCRREKQTRNIKRKEKKLKDKRKILPFSFRGKALASPLTVRHCVVP